MPRTRLSASIALLHRGRRSLHFGAIESGSGGLLTDLRATAGGAQRQYMLERRDSTGHLAVRLWEPTPDGQRVSEQVLPLEPDTNHGGLAIYFHCPTPGTSALYPASHLKRDARPRLGVSTTAPGGDNDSYVVGPYARAAADRAGGRRARYDHAPKSHSCTPRHCGAFTRGGGST